MVFSLFGMLFLIEEGDPSESFEESIDFSIRELQHKMHPQPGFHAVRQGAHNSIKAMSAESIAEFKQNLID